MPEKLFDIAANIRFGAVKAHLVNQHWVESASIYSNLAIFKTTLDGQEWQVKVPREPTQEDLYARGVADAIRVIAALRDEDPEALANLLRKQVIDIHRLHLPTTTANHLTAPLLQVKASVDSFADLLREAMFEEAEFDPKASSAAFSQSCEFAHTFSGSFGLSIEAPINQVALDSMLDGGVTPTAERRANLRISKGLQDLAAASVDGSYQMLQDQEETGLTRSMYKSLMLMAPVISSGRFEYEAYWSPFLLQEIPTPRVRIPAKAAELLERAAAHSAPVDEEITITFVGSIEKLQASRNDLLEADPDTKVFKFGIRGRSTQTGNCILTITEIQSVYRQALAMHDRKVEVEAVCKVKKRARGWAVISLESLREQGPSTPSLYPPTVSTSE